MRAAANIAVGQMLPLGVVRGGTADPERRYTTEVPPCERSSTGERPW